MFLSPLPRLPLVVTATQCRSTQLLLPPLVASNRREQESFSRLEEDNMKYVDEHRWPPLSYYAAMEEYKAKYGDLMEEDVLESTGGPTPPISNVHSSVNKSCMIM